MTAPKCENVEEIAERLCQHHIFWDRVRVYTSCPRCDAIAAALLAERQRAEEAEEIVEAANEWADWWIKKPEAVGPVEDRLHEAVLRSRRAEEKGGQR